MKKLSKYEELQLCIDNPEEYSEYTSYQAQGKVALAEYMAFDPKTVMQFALERFEHEIAETSYSDGFVQGVEIARTCIYTALLKSFTSPEARMRLKEVLDRVELNPVYGKPYEDAESLSVMTLESRRHLERLRNAIKRVNDANGHIRREDFKFFPPHPKDARYPSDKPSE